MLVDSIFQNIFIKPEMNNHELNKKHSSIQNGLRLMMTLSKVDNDWCRDRIIHMGFFECAFRGLKGHRFGAYTTHLSLYAIRDILSKCNEDD